MDGGPNYIIQQQEFKTRQAWIETMSPQLEG